MEKLITLTLKEYEELQLIKRHLDDKIIHRRTYDIGVCDYYYSSTKEQVISSQESRIQELEIENRELQARIRQLNSKKRWFSWLRL